MRFLTSFGMTAYLFQKEEGNAAKPHFPPTKHNTNVIPIGAKRKEESPYFKTLSSIDVL